MSSPSLELKISHLLKAILDGEKHLENYRKVLLEQALFDPHLTFNYLDQSNLGHISPSVIVNFLKKHDFEVLHIDLIVFFNSYDLSGNCQLSYSDFLNIILPRNCSSAPKPNRSRESSRTPNKRKPTISYEIEWALARLLDKQIAFLKKIEVIKKGLTRHGDFGLLQVFKQIDLNNVGAIDIDSLYVFLKKQKVTTSEDDTVILFRSIDHDNDDLLSYTEFTRVILPASLLAQSSVPNMSTSGMSTRRSSTPLAHRSKPPIGNITPSYPISHQRTPSMDNSKSTPRLSAHQRSYSISEKCNENKIRYNNEIGLLSDSIYRDTSRQQSPSPIYRGPLVQESPRFELYNSEIHSGNTGRKKESETNSVIRGYRVKDLPLARDLKLTPSRKSHSESVKAYREEEMGETEERDLANVLKEMINLDRESENMKNDLALQADLNLFNIFRLFDVEGRGFIDKCELEDGLNMFQVFPTEKELDLIMRRFDRDYDDMLRCSDFCNILTPSNREYADMLKSRIAYTKNAKKTPETLSIETTFLIRKTLQVIISNESYCECLKHRLNSKQGFTIQKAFKALDNERNGFIRAEDIKQLLNNNGLCASYKEIQGLMHRLTRKQDGRVTYNEFLEEMKSKITALCD